MGEYLHATNSVGRYVKTAERWELLREIREYSRRHGDAPVAVPAVHLLLLDGEGRLRLVQRGERPENPLLWDKSVGGHVVVAEPELGRAVYDDNLRKEVREEVGVERVTIVADCFAYGELLREGGVDLQREAVVRLIDRDYWMGSVCRVRDGAAWVKRHNVAVYLGVYDGPFRFADGEAIAEARVDKWELRRDLARRPLEYADGLHSFVNNYFHLLRI